MGNKQADTIINTAKRTLEIEAEAIQKLGASIGEEFVRCVEAIYQTPGRLVVTGIGKSAIVAQKIVATLNSTGTPAVFMHAADAIHGDLGMILPDDLILCLSKSGETAEIKVLAPLVQHLGAALIGMTSRPDSYLGRRADYLLHTPVDLEADPNNLAPTASTSVQMAMGDAIAIALLKLRGFGSRDFAQFHPGGALGKQLYLRVGDLYPHNPKPKVGPDTSLQEAILEITAKCMGATVVINDKEQLLGIITDGDLRRTLERSPDTSKLKSMDVMNSQPKTIMDTEMAIMALEKMRAYSITQLVVVDAEQHYLGLIHLHDLIREGLI